MGTDEEHLQIKTEEGLATAETVNFFNDLFDSLMEVIKSVQMTMNCDVQ